MNEILSTLLFGLTIVTLVLGLSCILMGVLSDKNGAEAIKERVEYGFMGVAGLAVTGLLFYAA